MGERGSKIGEIKKKKHTVEDRVFEDFCNEIGVENIRFYLLLYL